LFAPAFNITHHHLILAYPDIVLIETSEFATPCLKPKGADPALAQVKA
jgi:hypothetical protein